MLFDENVVTYNSNSGFGSTRSYNLITLTDEILPNLTIQADNDLNAKKYQVFYNKVLQIMQPFITYYKNANYENLKNDLTFQKYSNISTEIQNNTFYNEDALSTIIYNETTFNKYKDTFNDINDGLYKTIINYNDCLEKTERLNDLEELISDPNKLLEYIKITFENYGSLTELNVVLNTDVNPVIKPEYIIYIERYGFPIDGEFDTALLSNIILELSNT